MKKAVKYFAHVFNFLTVFILMAFCFVAIQSTVYASDESVLTVESVERDANSSEVTVNIKYTNNPGVAGMDFEVNFNQNHLTPISYTKTGMFATESYFQTNMDTSNKENIDKVTFKWIVASSATSNGTVASVKFKVKDLSVSYISLDIKCNDISASDYTNIPVRLEKGWIAIKNSLDWKNINTTETNIKASSNKNHGIRVLFNTQISSEGAADNIVLKKSGCSENVAGEPYIIGTAVYIKPKQNLEPNTEYVLELKSGISSAESGKTLGRDVTYRFTTSNNPSSSMISLGEPVSEA